MTQDPFKRMSDDEMGIESRRNDGWSNALTGLGTYQRDKRLAMKHLASYPLVQQELTEMFRHDDVVRRICELVPREMVREWIEITGDPDNKVGSKVELLNVPAKLYEAQVWARLHGGAGIILGINDGQSMDKPLNMEAIRSFDWMVVLSRWELQVVKYYGANAFGAQVFGEPELYRVVSTTQMPGTMGASALEALIHESRILRFEGALTERIVRRHNLDGWSDSVIQACYDTVRDFNQAFGGAANLLTDFSQAVFKIKNLANMLAADKDELVVKRMKYLDLSRSIARAVMLDADGEEFTRETTSLAGLPDTLDRIAQRLSAATDIPMTLLMGESPAGMNATGESDHRFFYNVVHNEQERRFRSPISKVLSIIAKVVGVKPSDAINNTMAFQFKSLWQESESDKEDTRLKVAQRDQIYFNMGALDVAEIAVSRFGGDKYSTETTLDKETFDPSKALPPDGNLDPNADPVVPDANSKGHQTDVQQTALNGAQVTALQGMLSAVGDGSLDPESAKIAIRLSFPAFPEADIKKMVDAIEVKEPKPMPVPGAFGQPPQQQQQDPNQPPKPGQQMPPTPPKKDLGTP